MTSHHFRQKTPRPLNAIIEKIYRKVQHGYQQKIRPHLQLWRVHRLIGFWLLLWPGLWALLLAQPAEQGLPFFWIGLFIVGAFFMRSAGCAINDIWDQKFDGKVSRTCTRPLPQGLLTTRAALISCGVALLGAGCTWLILPHNVQLLSLWAIPFVVIYPLIKRVSHWPQLFLGLTFNWSILMGWCLSAPLDMTALLLYSSGVLWTLAYDTIYAVQDRQDDQRIGLKSLALKMGDRVKVFSLICMGTASLLLISCAIIQASPDFTPLVILSLSLLSLLLAWNTVSLLSIDLDKPGDCHQYFLQQGWIGGGVFMVLLLQRF